ncbi:hypothetical protein ACHAW6_005769 [Cyclotella cf. meneghiniana]
MRTNNRKQHHQNDALTPYHFNEDKAGNAKETTTDKSIRTSHDHGQKRRKIIEPTFTGPPTEGCDPKLKRLPLFLNHDRTGMAATAGACPQRDPEWKQYMPQHYFNALGLDREIGPPQESIDPKLTIATSKLSQLIRPAQQIDAPTKVSVRNGDIDT